MLSKNMAPLIKNMKWVTDPTFSNRLSSGLPKGIKTLQYLSFKPKS